MASKALDNIGMTDLFSELGKRIFLPQGIFYWSGRAKKEAEINATIGSAAGPDDEIGLGDGDKNITFHLPMICNELPGLSSEDIFPYAPICGLPELRASWKSWVIQKSGPTAAELESSITLPIVLPGITGGLALMLELFVNPGEPIICPGKRWGNYDNIVIRRLNARFEEFPLFEDKEFNVQGMLQAIERVWKEHEKAVAVLNFPNNPTGYSPNAEVIDRLKEGLMELVEREGKHVILLFDDAYVLSGQSRPLAVGRSDRGDCRL